MARANMKEINKTAECQIGATPESQREKFLGMDSVPPVLALATALGETRSSLARRTGISLSTLSKWDAGSVSPRKRQIGKLLSGSPVSEAEFLARFEAFHPGVLEKPRKKKEFKEGMKKLIPELAAITLLNPTEADLQKGPEMSPVMVEKANRSKTFLVPAAPEPIDEEDDWGAL